MTKERPIEEIQAGDEFRQSLEMRADSWKYGIAPVWHGWALMDAFLAGIDWERVNCKDGKDKSGA